MGNNGIRAIGPARLITIAAAIGMLAAALALSGASPSGNGLTFRDVVYSHHVKLTGVASGTVKCTLEGKKGLSCTKISIRKGTKKVGSWTGFPLGSCPHVGPGCRPTWSGNGKMKIGSLKGKVKISIGCGFGHASGTITQAGAASEGITTKKSKCPGGKKGTKFKFTLSY